MTIDGHAFAAWLAWAVAVLALLGTWACFAAVWQGTLWLAGRRGDRQGNDRDWRDELVEDETRRQLEALPAERDWAEITGQQSAVEDEPLSPPPPSHPVWRNPALRGPVTGLSGPLGPAGPPVPYTSAREALSALMAEYERLEPAWKHECRVAYAVCLGADDPTMLRMAVR
jgi:hypothetical protein